jgi:hypothetical protein
MSSETQKLRGNSKPVLFDPFSSNTDSDFYLDYRYIGNETEEMRNLRSCKKDSYAFRNPTVSINVSAMSSVGAVVLFYIFIYLISLKFWIIEYDKLHQIWIHISNSIT